MTDPVRYIEDMPGLKDNHWGYFGPGWYFYDETWTHVHGPYSSELEARVELGKYVRTL